VEPAPAKLKIVYLRQECEPVAMGVHGPIAEHYHLAEGTFRPRASTLDYVVGATAACLTGTLNTALQAREIATDGGRLTVEAEGNVEIEDGVLVIKRIRVVARLRADDSKQAAAERVVGAYASKCPVYRSLMKAIDITTTLDFQPEQSETAGRSPSLDLGPG
jgi:uncharacterized OsmC-like protein